MNISYDDLNKIQTFIKSPLNEWIIKLLPNSFFTKEEDGKIYIHSDGKKYALEAQPVQNLDDEVLQIIIYLMNTTEKNIRIHFDQTNHLLYAEHVRDASKYGYNVFYTSKLEKVVTNENYQEIVETILSWVGIYNMDIFLGDYKFHQIKKTHVLVKEIPQFILDLYYSNPQYIKLITEEETYELTTPLPWSRIGIQYFAHLPDTNQYITYNEKFSPYVYKKDNEMYVHKDYCNKKNEFLFGNLSS